MVEARDGLGAVAIRPCRGEQVDLGDSRDDPWQLLVHRVGECLERIRIGRPQEDEVLRRRPERTADNGPARANDPRMDLG
jgi:hypothetical protein